MENLRIKTLRIDLATEAAYGRTRHVRGRLLGQVLRDANCLPKIVLFIKGRLAADLVTYEKNDTVTVLRPRTGRIPTPEVYSDLVTALKRVGGLA